MSWRLTSRPCAWDVWADHAEHGYRYLGDVETPDGCRYIATDNFGATVGEYATRGAAMNALKRRLTNSQSSGDADPQVEAVQA